MLVTWKQAQSSSDEQKMTMLCTALTKIGRADIAEFLHGAPAPRPQHSQRPDQEPRLGAPSYQEAGNKTGDSLKHETSQDTEVPRSPEPSHLQKVLDEVNKLKKNLSAREQLDSRVQLPYMAIGYFNEKGGSLSLDEYGVHLTIPRGAIASGPPQQVYIYVDPTAPQKGAVESTVVSLSPTVKCGPEGLRFKESVVLSFPHHAVLGGQPYDNLDVRMRHDDSQERRLKDGNPALVTEKEVFVLADHFTNFDLVGAPTPGSSKRMKVAAFGGVLGMQSRQYAFRVHVWNDDTSVERYVIREEEQRMNSKMLDVSRKILFVWDSGNLAVRVSDLNGGWTFWGAREEAIVERNVQLFPENSVTFNLKREDSQDRGLYCIARTFQRSPTEDSGNQSIADLKINPNAPDDILSTEGRSRCTCYTSDGVAVVCDNCMADIGTNDHGEVSAHDYGGLSEERVNSLCSYLSINDRHLTLLEKIRNLEGRSRQDLIGENRIRARNVLEIFFNGRRRTFSNVTDNEAIESLVQILIELQFTGAVDIIRQDFDEPMEVQ
ncbi:netrin receptor UNC5C-like [Patiria miniata]|uniref:Netrin receptor UNC5 n=1 Tax=Patiria miniata TaxID=46514 RepID=A0A913Z4E2_PATMI|nr:netrin receptor UNC5C-like [Patiria miniata]